MWANESVFYQIYPFGACGAPFENDHVLEHRIHKLEDFIPHLKKLKIDCIMLNPIFESRTHGYDTTDFKTLDTRLGTNEDLKEVVKQFHENGIQIILDAVFNHVGRDFFAFQDVLEKKWDSPYKDWFYIDFNGNNHYNDGFWYQDWEGNDILVKLNLQNSQVVEYILSVVDFWQEEFKIDGLRLDVAYCLDKNFLQTLHNHVDRDFFLLGETLHGDYNQWMNENMLDSVTNYECYKGLYSSFNSANFYEILYSLNRQFGKDPWCLYTGKHLFNFVDNHDVERVASILEDKNQLPLIYTMLFTMPGIPCIYYGSEWGIKGEKNNTDYDYPLRPELNVSDIQDNALLAHIRKLGKARTSTEALKYGSFENVQIRNEQLIFKRSVDSQTAYVALNLADNNMDMGFNADGAYLVDKLSGKSYQVNNGYVNIDIPAHSSRILVTSNAPTLEDVELEETKAETAPVAETEKKEEPVLPAWGTLGKHRHFKGGEYEVIALAKHSETMEDLVIYRELFGEGKVWARPASMFYQMVNIDGNLVPRFKFIG